MSHASSRILRGLLLCSLTSVGIYGGASCGSGESSGAGEDAGRPDLVFEGDANDTALAALTAVEGPVNPPTYAIFDLPSEGAVYSADQVPKVTWHMNAQPVPPDAGAEAGAFLLLPGPAAPAARAASLGPLLDLFGKERGAAAAGSSVNGLGYLLLFTTEKDSDLLRVFTTKTSYTPGPATLEIMKDIGASIQVWILTGVFDNNALTSYGGPFRGPWTSFELTE